MTVRASVYITDASVGYRYHILTVNYSIRDDQNDQSSGYASVTGFGINIPLIVKDHDLWIRYLMAKLIFDESENTALIPQISPDDIYIYGL